jgi:hypothetical protein
MTMAVKKLRRLVFTHGPSTSLFVAEQQQEHRRGGQQHPGERLHTHGQASQRHTGIRTSAAPAPIEKANER